MFYFNNNKLNVLGFFEIDLIFFLIFLGIGIDDVFILMFGIVDVEFIEKLSVFD